MWKEYIIDLRERIGATRSEFCDLLQINENTLNGWEYRNQIPSLFHRDVLSRMDSNIDGVKSLLEERRQVLSVLTPPLPTRQKNVNNLVDIGISAGIGAGVAFGIYKLLEAIFKDKTK